jgi:hypothetical protein
VNVAFPVKRKGRLVRLVIMCLFGVALPIAFCWLPKRAMFCVTSNYC